MPRLPPALAASATPRVLELGFGGIHATPIRLAGFEVVVVERDPMHRAAAIERAGVALAELPPERFDAVVAPAGADLAGVTARKTVLVGQDGSVWSSGSS